jgi:hypothetical protein
LIAEPLNQKRNGLEEGVFDRRKVGARPVPGSARNEGIAAAVDGNRPGLIISVLARCIGSRREQHYLEMGLRTATIGA